MSKNLDILFLGGLFPKEKEKEKEILECSKGNIQNAANNFQWGIVSGLDYNNGTTKILNSLYIGSFPKRYKKIKIKTYPFAHSKNSNENVNVGFWNISGIKNFSRFLTLKPYIKEWVNKKTENKKVVIAYAMTITFTSLLKYVKRLDDSVVTCLIVPDLPQYMNLSNKKSELYNILKKIEIKKIKKDLDYIDAYVFLTQYMKESLNISNSSVVVEGIATDNFKYIDNLSNENEIKMILYSGGLEKKYGVVELLSAFERLEGKSLRLIICGAGEAENDIIEAGKRDNRIIFRGLLPRNEVLQLQKSSTILVNPRPNNEVYTKYSFPSKVMEYLSSGTPMVAYNLDGMPNEYSDYFYVINDVEDGLYETLKEVISKPKKVLKEKGMLAKNFVLTYKNEKVQTKKIIDMINGVAIR